MTNPEIRLIHAIERIPHCDDNYFELTFNDYGENFYVPAFLPWDEEGIVDTICNLTGKQFRKPSSEPFVQTLHFKDNNGTYINRISIETKTLTKDKKLEHLQNHPTNYPPSHDIEKVLEKVPNKVVNISYDIHHHSDPIEFIYNSGNLLALGSILSSIIVTHLEDVIPGDFTLILHHDYRPSLKDDLDDVINQFNQLSRGYADTKYPKILVNKNVKEGVNYTQEDFRLIER